MLAGLSFSTGIIWIIVESRRVIRLRRALMESLNPASRMPLSTVMLRRLHRIFPPYMLVILGPYLLARAPFLLGPGATAAQLKIIADIDSSVDKQFAIAAGGWTLIYVFFIILRCWLGWQRGNVANQIRPHETDRHL
jgi:hypothetical protein